MPIIKKWGKKGGAPPPKDFAYLEPVLEAMENELRDKVQESNVAKRNTESIWPVHQICWQRTRYVYDMYYTHKKIDRETYDYCIRQKIVDGNLIAKWKKTGYERLCSTYVINPANFKFGTTSICRVPLNDRDERQIRAQDPTTGCLGCASGAGAGPRNIFGNKYGQDLAAVQVARERRTQEEVQRIKKQNNVPASHPALEKSQETNEDEHGPIPAMAGTWPEKQQLDEAGGNQSEQDVGDSETDESEGEEEGSQPVEGLKKRQRLND